MSLARDIVELDRSMKMRTDVDPFLPIDQAGILPFPESAEIVERLEGAVRGDSSTFIRVCLQVLRIQFDQLSPQLLNTELVATLPPGIPGIARPTNFVIREMLPNASTEVILLGYEFTDGGTIELLADASRRGSDVIIICDRERGAAQRIGKEWPPDAPLPRVFINRKRDNGIPYTSMHAKCLLVDGSDLLITSANFTFHGLQGNIEIGVRLSGSPASEARKIFSHLVEAGIVEEQIDGKPDLNLNAP